MVLSRSAEAEQICIGPAGRIAAMKTPAYTYEIDDPDLDITYFVYSSEPIKTLEEVWHYVARFLGIRKRRLPVSWKNLPKVVKLAVQENGTVTDFDSPNLRAIKKAQRIENQKKWRIQNRRRKNQPAIFFTPASSAGGRKIKMHSRPSMFPVQCSFPGAVHTNG
jgi:hypothetical protein